MFETVIGLKPENEWRPGMTVDLLIAEMDQALQFPGVSNAWTMPIKARIDMLSTGIRTPVGIKLFGPNLEGLERVARDIEAAVRPVPGTTSVYAERVMGGYYVNIEDRATLVRYGLMVGNMQEVVRIGLGAEAVTTTVEGRERYTVNVRYPQAYRSDPQAIAASVLIPLPNGSYIPLGQVAKVSLTKGPPSVRTENAQLVVYTTSTFATATSAVLSPMRSRRWPNGSGSHKATTSTWSGQFEYMQRAKTRMKIVVPITLLIISRCCISTSGG